MDWLSGLLDNRTPDQVRRRLIKLKLLVLIIRKNKNNKNKKRSDKKKQQQQSRKRKRQDDDVYNSERVSEVSIPKVFVFIVKVYCISFF